MSACFYCGCGAEDVTVLAAAAPVPITNPYCCETDMEMTR